MEWKTASTAVSESRYRLARDCRHVLHGLLRHQRELDCSGAVSDALRLLEPIVAQLQRLYETECNAVAGLPEAINDYLRRVLAPTRAGFALALVVAPLKEAIEALVTWELPDLSAFGIPPESQGLVRWHRHAAERLRAALTPEASGCQRGGVAAPLDPATEWRVELERVEPPDLPQVSLVVGGKRFEVALSPREKEVMNAWAARQRAKCDRYVPGRIRDKFLRRGIEIGTATCPDGCRRGYDCPQPLLLRLATVETPHPRAAAS